MVQTFGVDFFITSVTIFSEEINGRIAVLEQAASGSEDARREAHAIKGSAASYGLISLSAIAAQLEENPDRLAASLPEIREHWRYAKPIMDALCQTA